MIIEKLKAGNLILSCHSRLANDCVIVLPIERHRHAYFVKFLALVIVAAIVFASCPTKADRYYSFIKIACDKTSKTITLNISPLDKGEDAEDIVDQIRSGQRSNLYFFGDLVKSGKKISCDLGGNLAISFAGYQNTDHPRNDNIEMFVLENHAPISFQTLPMDSQIHFLNADDYTVRQCSFSRSNKDKKCVLRHVVNGECVKERPQQKGCS